MSVVGSTATRQKHCHLSPSPGRYTARNSAAPRPACPGPSHMIITSLSMVSAARNAPFAVTARLGHRLSMERSCTCSSHSSPLARPPRAYASFIRIPLRPAVHPYPCSHCDAPVGLRERVPDLSRRIRMWSTGSTHDARGTPATSHVYTRAGAPTRPPDPCPSVCTVSVSTLIRSKCVAVRCGSPTARSDTVKIM